MNHDTPNALAQLERELQSLQPVAPDPLFLRKLENSMSAAAPAAAASSPLRQRELPPNVIQPSAFRRWAPWTAAAAATVAIATPLILNPVRNGGDTARQQQTETLKTTASGQPVPVYQAPDPATVAQWVPLRIDKQLQNVHDVGLHYDQQTGLRRNVRFQFDNRQQFQNPASGSIFEYIFPSEEEVWILEPVH
jgi:hypothetical protein